MIYLSNFKQLEDGRTLVGYMHTQPQDLNKTSEELNITGLLVDSLPTVPVKIQGKSIELFIDLTTNNIYYDYVDLPKINPEVQAIRITQLEAENANISYALMMGGII